VRERLESRLILVEDIQQVIEYAERTGRRLLNPVSGHLLAHFKPTAVTYWVEYTPEGEAFVVHNAYSHRMEITEGDRK
jgi:glutamate synthase (NADPH/NADH) small chain